MTETRKRMPGTRTTADVGALALALGLAACTADPQQSTADRPPNGESRTAPTTDGAASAYRDGEYSATGWYGSLPSHQNVTLTIQDDAVTAVEITTPAEGFLDALAKIREQAAA